MAPLPPAIVVRHSHMDQEWLIPFERSRRRFDAVLAEVVAGLEADADERFTLDGVPFLDAALRGAPVRGEAPGGSAYQRLYTRWLELGSDRGDPGPHDADRLRERLRALVARGQLEIVGGYVQPDCNLPAGEALVRQGLFARRWFARELGTVPSIAWNLDCFGQCSQLPQILAGCGYRGVVLFRIGPIEDPSGPGGPAELHGAFCFQAPDGTSLPAHTLPEGYDPGVVRHPRALARLSTGRRLPAALARLHRRAGGHPVLLPFGGEFSAVVPGLAAALDDLRAAAPGRASRLGTAGDYFDALAASDAPLPTHRGDLNPVFPGTHALRPELKRADRVLHGRLCTAEALDALLMARRADDAASTRARQIERAWSLALTNQAHDSLAGCHVPPVTRDVLERHRRATAAAGDAADAALDRLSRRAVGERRGPWVRRRSRDRAIALFNPLGHARREVVSIPWRGPAPAAVRGPDGDERPLRLRSSRRGAVLEVLADAPPFGFGLLRAVVSSRASSGPACPPADPRGDGPLCVHPGDDGVVELRRADGDRPIATLGPLTLERDTGNAYLSRPGARLGELIPGRWAVDPDGFAPGGTLHGSGRLGPGEATWTVEACPGRDWLRIELAGRGLPTGARVRLPVRTTARRPVPYEVPFAEQTRPGPAAIQGYVRLDGEAGLANLGVPACESGPGAADAILIRSVRLLSQRRPLLRLRIPIDATPDRWRATFAAGPHARRAARELASPLLGRVLAWPWPAARRVPAARSLLDPIDAPDSVEVVALKRPEAGAGLVIRLAQMGPDEAVARIPSPGKGSWRRTDLAERAEQLLLAMDDGSVPVRMRPWEVATVLWRPLS